MRMLRLATLGVVAILFGLSRRDDDLSKYKNDTWSFSLVPPPFSYPEKLIAKIIAFFSLPPGDDASAGEEVWVYQSMEWAEREGLSESRGSSVKDLAKTTIPLGSTSGTRHSWSREGARSKMSWTALVVQGKDRVFVVRCRAKSSEFGDLQGAFESSLASFRVNPDPPASKTGPTYADAAWGFSLAPVVFPKPSIAGGPIEVARFMGPSQPNYPTAVRMSVHVQSGSMEEFQRATAKDLESIKSRKELNLRLTPEKKCTINSLSAVEYVYSYDSMLCGRNNKYMVTCIEGPQVLYVLTCEALESEFDKIEDAFRKSTSSFVAEK